jgi:DNA-directed RNA polymerase specialized sigma24 family protein
VLDRLREAARRKRQRWTTERHDSFAVGRGHDPTPARQMLIERDDTRQLAEAIAQLPVGRRRSSMHKLEGQVMARSPTALESARARSKSTWLWQWFTFAAC